MIFSISMQRLVWVCSICLCHTKRMLGLFGLISCFLYLTQIVWQTSLDLLSTDHKKKTQKIHAVTVSVVNGQNDFFFNFSEYKCNP